MNEDDDDDGMIVRVMLYVTMEMEFVWIVSNSVIDFLVESDDCFVFELREKKLLVLRSLQFG